MSMDRCCIRSMVKSQTAPIESAAGISHNSISMHTQTLQRIA